eukprot:4604794-Pleurochrysis_carterae.AAC.3
MHADGSRAYPLGASCCVVRRAGGRAAGNACTWEFGNRARRSGISARQRKNSRAKIRAAPSSTAVRQETTTRTPERWAQKVPNLRNCIKAR